MTCIWKLFGVDFEPSLNDFVSLFLFEITISRCEIMDGRAGRTAGNNNKKVQVGLWNTNIINLEKFIDIYMMKRIQVELKPIA